MTAPLRTACVTGAAGFTGSRLVEGLARAGWDVTALDRRASTLRGVVKADTSAPGHWQALLAGSDLVVHAAALDAGARSSRQTWNHHALATQHVVDACADVGRLIYLSPTRAFSGRRSSVGHEEIVLRAHAAGRVQAMIVRPGDVYGPESRPWTVRPIEALLTRRLVLPAWGHGSFAPLYVDDLVAAIVWAAEADGRLGEVVTVTDGVAVSCEVFFGYYAAMLGVAPPKRLPTPVAEALALALGSVDCLRRRPTHGALATVRQLARTDGPSPHQGAKALGFSPSVQLEEGMRRVEAWLFEEGLLPALGRRSR